jgi:lipopolysaccharide transport system ATP-binding protein
MRVRLAFAVAAHLEPDILVVDEVLAVGDAEFQKKAIGKMQDISQGQGRTVLFVSHNMAAIRDLCTRAIVLNNGVSVFSGAVNKAIEFYLKDNANANSFEFINTSVKTNDLITLHLMNAEKKVKGVFGFEEVISLAIKLKLSDTLFKYKPLLGIRVSDKLDRNIFTTEQSVFDLVPPKDEILIKVDIPNSLLVPNDYNVSLGFHIPNKEVIFKYDAIVSFEIEESGFSMYRYVNRDLGCVFVNCDWTYLDEDSHNK